MNTSSPGYFFSEGFMPHGHCYLWRPDILWLQVISDTLIGFAYFMIPLALIYLVRKRSDLAFNWLFILFASFIVACGMTHFIEVWTVWNPDYALSGLVKLATALISMGTAVTLWPLMPRIIEMPGVDNYKRMCQQLESEVIERKKAQDELERRENQLRLIINQLPVAIAYLNKDLRFQYCNATYAKWQNKTKPQIIGQHVKDVLPEQNLHNTASSILQALSGTSSRSLEKLRLVDAERDVAIEDIPDVDAQGQVKGVIRLVTDISEHVEIEHELKRAKDAADASNLAKSAFVANISHEIRTPLGAVVGFSDMLTRNHISASDRNKYIAAIKRNSDLLVHIIDDLLDISKMEAGKIILDEQDVDLREIIGDASHYLQQQALAKGIHFCIAAEKPLPQFVRTDPYRLKQILINLIGNAIKFSESGTVELSVRCMPEPGKPQQLAFFVSDQGNGIPEEHKAHLFEPFYQADPSATRRYGGTGLGLTLSRRFAQMLGGDIQLVRSEVGKGTLFLVTINPAETRGIYAEEEAKEPERAAAPVVFLPGAHLHGAKVLVAEDAIDNQVLISTYLESAGAQVEMTSNGQEALDKLQTSDADVVLMDLQMPVMSGFEALSELRKAGRHIPVIALTAHAKQDDKKRCLDAGFDNHIGKPINRNELIEKISFYVNQEQQPLTH